MKTTKLFTTFILTLAVMFAQTGSAFAQDTATFTVIDLACGTDGTTVLVTYDDEDATTAAVTAEISLEDAVTLGFLPASSVACDEASLIGEGDPIDPATLTPVEEEPKHPVGAALAAFFEGIADYDAIMEAHEDGTGFGVIAQALWMTKKLDSADITFDMIITAKKDGDYSGFGFEEGSVPQNWGQFKKAVLNGDKKNNLGQVMSDKEKPDNGKPEKSNNGKGEENKGKGNDK